MFFDDIIVDGKKYVPSNSSGSTHQAIQGGPKYGDKAVGWVLTFAAAAYNPDRMRNLAVQVRQGEVLPLGRENGSSAASIGGQNSSLSHKIAEPGCDPSRIIPFSAAC